MANDNIEIGRYEPLSELICKTLREAIVKGELKPGERLMEIHYAEKLGVSRTPFREALRRLEQEGLVTVLPRRGAMVSQLSKSDITEVLEIRSALDALASSLCAQRISAEEMDELERTAALFERYIEERSVDALVEADIRLHEIIYRSACNTRLNHLYGGLKDQIHRYRRLYLNDISDYASLSDEHSSLIDAIRRRDGGRAADIARVHIRNQEQAILEALDRN